MSRFVAIPATTGSATSQVYDASQYDSITVSADNLAGGETVTLQVVAGATPKQITDIYGTVINLTATVSAVALEGGPFYQFVKSATASACAVYVDPKQLL
jgi:hypothetical protein